MISVYSISIQTYFPYSMQYKIPLQIENEDTIVAGLSIRQLVIMMMWGGV